jgi:hypothetical protein
MQERNQLVGRIILSNFLEYSPEKFLSFVAGIEQSLLYRRLVRAGVIMPKLIPSVSVLTQNNILTLARSGIVAKIEGEDNFLIHYTVREFATEYQVSPKKLARCLDTIKLSAEDTTNISRLLNKLRRINTRNQIVDKILRGIVEYQRDYFATGDELNLKHLTIAQLASFISDHQGGGGQDLDFSVDISRISRATRGLSLITPKGREVPLRLLFASRRDTVKRCIKSILSREKGDVSSGQIVKPYTDEELRRKIEEDFGLVITRREVSHCRKELGILPHFKRNGYVYYTLAASFSQLYPFTSASVKANAPACPGVYELCLGGSGIEYPSGCCQTFYVGSTKNIRKRLFSHLSLNSKNDRIQTFIKEGNCLFRYLRVPQGWAQEEKKVYNLFISTYGNSPICNHVSPKAASKQQVRETGK